MVETRYGTAVAAGTDGDDAAETVLSEACHEAGLDPADVDFVATFVSPVYDYESVVERLRTDTDEATLIGASSAGEFNEDGARSESIAAAVVASEDMNFHTGIGTGLSGDTPGAVAEATSQLPETDAERPYAAGINLHDGLLGRGEEIAMRAYQHRPMPYAGASAADDRRLEETVVFADDTVATDAVALGMVTAKQPFGTAVGHAHEPLSEGYRVTEVDGSVVHTLDGRPAYEVWTDAVREHAAEELGVDIDSVSPDEDRFRELLTQYEFGIQTSDDEYKIRWPGLTPDAEGPLHFATEIPEGAEMFVMYSDPPGQLDAQVTTAAAAVDAADVDFAGGLAFDCICQVDILGDEFDDGVERMAEELSVPFAGMEVYGEVGVDEDDMRTYHNATSSLLLFPA